MFFWGILALFTGKFARLNRNQVFRGFSVFFFSEIAVFWTFCGFWLVSTSLSSRDFDFLWLYRGFTSVGLVFWGVPCLGLVSGSFRDFLAKLRVGEDLLLRTYSLLSARGFWRVVVLNFHGRMEMMLRRSGG